MTYEKINKLKRYKQFFLLINANIKKFRKIVQPGNEITTNVFLILILIRLQNIINTNYLKIKINIKH